MEIHIYIIFQNPYNDYFSAPTVSQNIFSPVNCIKTASQNIGITEVSFYADGTPEVSKQYSGRLEESIVFIFITKLLFRREPETSELGGLIIIVVARF
jgi:hypothetical protein